MQRLPLLIATHALVLGAGYGWHRATAVPDLPPASTPTSPARPAARPTVREAGSVSDQPGESPWSASECRKAWQALKYAGLSPTELAMLRSKILAEWAAKDLRSALIAWSGLGRPKPGGLWVAGGAITSGPLIDRGFSFKGHEEELLDWINAGDFGLDSGQLLGILIGRSMRPELMQKLLPKVPPELQLETMRKVFWTYQNSPEPDRTTMNLRIAEIAKLPDERLRLLAWQAALTGMASRGGEPFFENLDRPDLPPEARRAALERYAGFLAHSQSAAEAATGYNKLMPEDQASIAPALLAEAETLQSIGARVSAVTDALTLLVGSGQWELLATKGPAAVDMALKSPSPNPSALSRWALQLPAREETAETFRHAVDAKFRSDLAGSVAWARSLPVGWHREQALAQLAITAGTFHHDAATRDAVLAEVTDPAILTEVRERLRAAPE
jgi:hypothetical protein